MLRHLPIVILLFAAAGPAAAQIRPTPNTLGFDPDLPRPAATLADVGWLVGHWRGPGLGGISEEVWTAPLGGSMMGSYRLVRGDSVIFYEILTLTEADGSLVMRLKHFDADLTGWEERTEVVSFPLVRMAPGEAYFDGLTMRRLAADHLQIQLAIRMSDGSYREEEFLYTAVR